MQMTESLARALANAAYVGNTKARQIAQAKFEGIAIGANRCGVGGGTEFAIQMAAIDALRACGPRPGPGLGQSGNRWMTEMVEKIMAAEL